MPSAWSNILQHADWTFPIAIHYGPGRLSEIAGKCRAANIIRPLVVTDKGCADLPFVQRTLEFLEADGLPAKLFSGVDPNPTDRNVAEGVEVFRSSRSDGVIALGGGSGMDGGKGIALTAYIGADKLWSLDFMNQHPPSLSAADTAPFLCVPTTAGTGAETESTAMFTDTEEHVKKCVWNPGQRPAAAILDPEITVGLPPDLTAWTGCDALVHALEAYFIADFHPLCDAAALQALRMIAPALPRAYRNGDDLEARGAMLVGSCLAGISFLKGLGLVHAISQTIGGLQNTQHGLTNAVLLPAVLGFNRPMIEHKVADVANAMGLADTSFEAFLDDIVRLLEDLGIPDNLKATGATEECIEHVADKAPLDSCYATNPRQASREDIAGLVTECLEKAW